MSVRRVVSIALVLVLAATLTACSQPASRLLFEPSGAALSGTSAEQLAASTDVGVLAGVTAASAPSERDTVLRMLRTKGPLGARAADLLTTGFPARTAAVPVLVRACTVDGVDAIVVVEAFGDASGPLTHRRLWVFDQSTGRVTRAASFR
jgi:hypothetical protein